MCTFLDAFQQFLRALVLADKYRVKPIALEWRQHFLRLATEGAAKTSTVTARQPGIGWTTVY